MLAGHRKNPRKSSRTRTEPAGQGDRMAGRESTTALAGDTLWGRFSTITRRSGGARAGGTTHGPCSPSRWGVPEGVPVSHRGAHPRAGGRWCPVPVSRSPRISAMARPGRTCPPSLTAPPPPPPRLTSCGHAHRVNPARAVRAAVTSRGSRSRGCPGSARSGGGGSGAGADRAHVGLRHQPVRRPGGHQPLPGGSGLRAASPGLARPGPAGAPCPARRDVALSEAPPANGGAAPPRLGQSERGGGTRGGVRRPRPPALRAAWSRARGPALCPRLPAGHGPISSPLCSSFPSPLRRHGRWFRTPSAAL